MKKVTLFFFLCAIGLTAQAQVVDSIKIDSTTHIQIGPCGRAMNPAVQPLFILNGKRISGDSVQHIKPESIESIDVLKGEKTIPYGESGKNGVIIIKLKDATKPKSFNKKP